jgi:hypothetical protein
MVGRRIVVAAVSAVVGVALAAAPAGAVGTTWVEAGDAPGIPPTAQALSGSGPLTRITGRVTHFNDDDLFKVCLTGGGTFSAEVVPRPLAGNFLDPQLFLFDHRGRGVYANDDRGPFDVPTGDEAFFPRLPAHHALTPTAAGVYYLGISNFDNDPLSPRGPIFAEALLSSDVVGPSDQGGTRPLYDWTDAGFGPTFSRYTIRLTGARYC